MMNANDNTSPLGRTWRVVGWTVLIVAAVVGLWAIAVHLSDSPMMHSHATQHVPWGLHVALYIFFLGLSAGAFLLSTLIYVFGVKRFETAGPLALIQALGCLGLGVSLIWLDLGHPMRFHYVFVYFNPSSVLDWMVLFYVAYSVILFAELFIVFRPALAARARGAARGARFYRILALGDKVDEAWKARAARWLKWLGIVGIPVAIGVHGGTGALFAVVKTRPSWYTGLFPIVFLVSALASGGALLTFLTAVGSGLSREKRLPVVQGLARLTVGIVALDLLLILSEVLVVFYGGMPHHVAGWHEVFLGPFWWVFWFVQIGLGAIVPILLVAGRRTGSSLGWLGLAGLLVVFGIIGVRLNIVIPAQVEPMFATLPDAYHHVRFARGYFPSMNEWLVGMGAIALGLLGYLGARRVLPLDEAEREAVTHASAGGKT